METEQERVVNRLIREIDEMRAREQSTIQQMEAEQDRLAISFMKRVDDMRKEREQIVNSMEFESEAVVNKMLQQRDAVSVAGEGVDDDKAQTPEAMPPVHKTTPEEQSQSNGHV